MKSRQRAKAASLAISLFYGAASAVPATASLGQVALPSSPAASTKQTPSSSAPQHRVVIAAIELTAVNMYHEWFHLGGALYPEKAPSSVNDAVLREFGIDQDHIIDLTRTGNVEADIAADIEKFDAVKPGEPYWYKGTNVIGVSFAPDGARLRSDRNVYGAFTPGHATAVTAAALKANPEAIVVLIQSPNAEPLTATAEEQSATLPAELSKPLGEKWAFNHPAVDIVNTSYGSRYNFPYGDDLADGYKGVVEGGKMHVGTSSNPNTGGFMPTMGSNSSGPWWTIGVGGYFEGGDSPNSLSADGNEYRESASGQLIDVVVDYSQKLPLCAVCQKGVAYPPETNGTSFAGPRAAGTLSTVVLEARRAAKHKGGIRLKHGAPPVMVEGHGHTLTVWQVRRAMEEAAYYPSDDLTDDPMKWDAVPGAPWLTHGWGAVSPDPNRGFVPEALAQLGISGVPRPAKPVEACAFQTAGIRLRQEYWNRVAPFSDSRGKDADPFLPCFKQPGL